MLEPAKFQFRIDTTTGIGETEPYREPAPFDVFEAHPVRGDFEKYGGPSWEPTRWHPQDRSATYPKGALVSPQGMEIDLALFDMGSFMTAAGDRFLVDGLDGLRLFTSDGKMAGLVRNRIERATP